MGRRRRKNLKYHLGNVLIFLSVTAIFFVYSPLVMLYLDPPKINSQVKGGGFYLTIPKIEAQAPIIANVDPWNSDDYLNKLQQGIGDADGSVDPGENGLIYLFAHSSDLPWRITRYNTAFLRLGELAAGDNVLINKDGRQYKYIVYDKKVIWPTDLTYIKELSDNKKTGSASAQVNQTLILQTCTPIGTSLKRLLIFAKPE